MVLTCHQSHNWELEQYHICPQYILNFLTFALDISFITFLKDKYRHKSLHVCLTLVVAKDGPNISIFACLNISKQIFQILSQLFQNNAFFLIQIFAQICQMLAQLFQNNAKIFVLYFYILIYMFYIVFINIVGRLNYFKTIL